MRDSHFRRTTTREESLLLYQTAQHTLCVVQTSLGLVENEGVGTSADDADGLGSGGTCRLNAGDLGDARAERRNLLDKVCASELVLCE